MNLLRIFFFSLMTCISSISLAQGNANTYLQVFKEQKDNHRIYGLAWYASSTFSGGGLAQYGFSASTVESDRPLERFDRDTIYPVYMFARAGFDYSISPYIEAGADVGDLLFDKAHEGEADRTDIYFAAGLMINFERHFNINLYAKSYHFRFLEIDDPLLKEVTIDTLGVGLGFNF